MTPAVRALWLRANESLAATRLLLPLSPDIAASRAYYAAFYAVSALFGLEDRWFRRHSALQAAVHRDLVRTARVGSDFGRDFDRLVYLRERGDYGADERVEKDDAAAALGAAERIVAAVGIAAPDLSADSGRAD